MSEEDSHEMPNLTKTHEILPKSAQGAIASVMGLAIKAGIGNEGYNKLISNVLKFGKIFSKKQSVSFKLESS